MSRYEYLCPACGSFDLTRPIGTAAAIETCPSCTAAAPRRFTAPALNSAPSPLSRAREAADRSAHEPAVSSGPRPSLRRRPAPNPLHARLPRP